MSPPSLRALLLFPLTLSELARSINKHKAKQTAMMLREEQLRNELALMSETTSVGLVRTDRKGKILMANKAWYDVVCLKPDQPPELWVDAMHADDRKWVVDAWAE